MQATIAQAAKYPNSRIHYLKTDSGYANMMLRSHTPTFSDARSVKYFSKEETRKLSPFSDGIARCFSKSDAPELTEVRLPNLRGDWIKSIPTLVASGFGKISVVLSRDQDESRSARRMCIPIPDYNILFVPNYKCGYSSMRQYVANALSSKRGEAVDIDSVVREVIDLLRYDLRIERKISIVRDPWCRFSSFYKDKILIQKNYPLYGRPVEALCGSTDPLTVLRFIGDMPDEFRDPHVKSQYCNLFFEGKCLVDVWYKLEDIAGAPEAFLAHLGLPGEFPYVRKTSGSVRPLIGEGSERPFADLLSNIYRRDFQTFGYDFC